MKTKIIQVHPEFPDTDVISQCAHVIRKGGLVIFPTETVYGIAADYSNPTAMRRLRRIKERPDDKPFSLLISQTNLISNYAVFEGASLYKLMHAFWPGPLTIVLPDKNHPGKTVGIRMPDNIVALKLVQESRCPIAAPSANRKGESPPTTCAEALAALDGEVELAIDGGAAEIGRGSTVVDITQKAPVVLREGSITREDIQKTIDRKNILFVCTGNSCRSVMAEYLLKQTLGERDDVAVHSAGTGVFLHSTASHETISVLRERGIDATRHMSQPINSILLRQSDLIFVMTTMHRMQVLDRAPDIEKRIYLMKEFIDDPAGGHHNMDIPDPMGGTHAAYENCLRDISRAVDKIATLV